MQDSDTPARTEGDRGDSPPADVAARAERQPQDGGESGDGFVGHAMLVSGLTLLSRLTGLARDAVLAAVFGLGAVADAWTIGFLVPNLFRRLFGEGALAAAFIPSYTDLLHRDPSLARRFAGLTVAVLSLLLAGITLAGEAGLYWAMTSGEWSDRGALALRLTMLMLPYMPAVCLVALLGGMLQVHKRFGPPAAAPILLNLCIISASALAAWGVGSGDAEQVAQVTALAVVGAGLLQVLWLGAVSLRVIGGLPTGWQGAGPAFRAMLRLMAPMVLGLAVFQINALLDTLIAIGLSPSEEGRESFTLLGRTLAYPLETGDAAALAWAQRLYQFPLGVFGIAVATAIFPALAHAAAHRSDEPGAAARADSPFAGILRRGLRLTVFIGLPASVGLVLVRVPLSRVVYERGAFSVDDAGRVAAILMGYASSIWAYSMMHILTRAFYAMKNATTPLKVSVGMVGLNLCMNLVLIWPLGAAGLAWSTAITAAIQVLILLKLVRRYAPQPVDGAVLGSWGRIAIGSAVMAAVLLPAGWLVDFGAGSSWYAASVLAVMVAVGAVVVLGLARLTGAEELGWLLRRKRA